MTPPPSFTYDDLVEAPRPQGGKPSPDRKRTINLVDQWDPTKQQMTRTVYLVNLPHVNNGDLSIPTPIKLFSCTAKEASSFFWLNEVCIGYFSGQTVKYINIPSSIHEEIEFMHKELFTFPSGIEASFLTFERDNGLLAFRARVWEKDGDFDKVEEGGKKEVGDGNGVRYDELFIRFKDKWRVPGKVYTIGMIKLAKHGEDWAVGDINGERCWNALRGTGLYSQIPSFTSSAIALTSSHLIVATKPPKLNPAIHTRMDIYIFPLSLYEGPLTALPTNITSGYDHGEVEFLFASDDGQKIVWTERERNGDEASKRNVYVWEFKNCLKIRWVEEWDASPSEVKFSKDGNSLFWLSDTKGRVLPYFVPGPEETPVALHTEGFTESLSVLEDKRILVGKSDTFNPLNDYIIDIPDDPNSIRARDMRQITDWSSSYLNHKLDGISSEEYWFENDQGRQVMGWIIKPRGFDGCKREKTYPMTMLIHGGPQSAFRDMWLIRWSPILYASYGYVVVCINPTGSRGYGQKFIDDLRFEFGGRDVNDLEKGYKAVLADFPAIDPERTAALGASSGGQLIHCINGCNERFGFKALVSHAGIWDETQMAYETDELWLNSWDAGIDPNTDQFKSEKYNPADRINKWNTPTMVIHGAKDFRVPESNAICAFTALQWRGVPSRLLYFPDEAHRPEKPNNVKQWYREIFQFLDEWIGH